VTLGIVDDSVTTDTKSQSHKVTRGGEEEEEEEEEDLFVFNDTIEGPRRERESFIRNYSP
jgi:hypothetical protein